MLPSGKNTEPIDQLLADRSVDPREPADLLELLAAAGRASAAWVDHGQLAGLPAVESPVEPLDRLLSLLLPDKPPPAAEDLEAWLLEVEKLALARRGVDRLPAALAGPDVAHVLDKHLARADTFLQGCDDLWLFAGRAAGAAVRDVLPWTRIVSGKTRGVFGQPPHRPTTTIRFWMDGRLHPEDAEALRELVCSASTPWLAAYRDEIGFLNRVIHVARWNPAWSLDVANGGGNKDAALLLSIPLPHLGTEQRLEVRQHADGTCWKDPTAPDGGGNFPSSVKSHDWGDATTGRFTTEIEYSTPEPIHDAWQAVCSVREVAAGKGGKRAFDVAIAVTEALEHGLFHDKLAEAAAAFERGDNAPDEPVLWVSHALRARLALGDAVGVLDDDRLRFALANADVALAGYSAATLLLDPDEYREIVEGALIDEDAWWGRPVALDKEMPLERVTDALAFRRDRLPAPPAPPGERQPQPSVLNAAGGTSPESPSPLFGKTPLLLVDSSRRAIVAELRIVHDRETGLWRGDDRLRALALDAVRAAYFAVAKQMPGGWPRYPLDHHRIDIVLPENTTEQMIDGNSIGLPAALAFASLWLEVPLPLDLASTGALQSWEEPTTIVRVDAVREKSMALAAAGSSTRLVCPGEDAEEARVAGLTVVEVSTLHQAFAAAGLDFSRATPSPDLGDLDNRRVELQRLVTCVDSQRLIDFKHSTMDPWLALGDQIRMLLHSLQNDPDPDPDALNHARVRAALAFTHAGDDKAAAAMLKELDDHGCDDPYAHVIRDIVEMESLIDGDENDRTRWVRCDRLAEQLDRRVREMPEAYQPLVAGRVLGSEGRSFTHRREPERAVPFLRAAVEEHERRAPRETGRSRAYLAMALRMAGRYDEALAELDRAYVNIQSIRTASQPYYASCLMFWHYERARLLVGMGRAEEAIFHAREALAEASWRGVSPKLGVLRTLAWAEQLRGDYGRAEDRAKEIEAVVSKLPKQDSPLRRYAERVLAEVRGGPRRDGEIY